MKVVVVFVGGWVGGCGCLCTVLLCHSISLCSFVCTECTKAKVASSLKAHIANAAIFPQMLNGEFNKCTNPTATFGS